MLLGVEKKRKEAEEEEAAAAEGLELDLGSISNPKIYDKNRIFFCLLFGIAQAGALLTSSRMWAW